MLPNDVESDIIDLATTPEGGFSETDVDEIVATAAADSADATGDVPDATLSIQAATPRVSTLPAHIEAADKVFAPVTLAEIHTAEGLATATATAAAQHEVVIARELFDTLTDEQLPDTFTALAALTGRFLAIRVDNASNMVRVDLSKPRTELGWWYWMVQRATRFIGRDDLAARMNHVAEGGAMRWMVFERVEEANAAEVVNDFTPDAPTEE